MSKLQENKSRIAPYRSRIPRNSVLMIKNQLKNNGIQKNTIRIYNFFRGRIWDDEIFEGLQEVVKIHENYKNLNKE